MATEQQQTRSEALRVYDFTKWAILQALLQAGDRITLSWLSAEAGAAEAACREALLRLEVEALVVIDDHGAATVTQLRAEDADHLLDARRMVELYVVDGCFARRADILPAVEIVHAEMQASAREQDTVSFAQGDRSFHELLVDGAGNPVVSQYYRSLRERQVLLTAGLVRGHAERMQDGLDQHELLLTALRGDDVEAYRRAVRDHFDWTVRIIHSTW